MGMRKVCLSEPLAVLAHVRTPRPRLGLAEGMALLVELRHIIEVALIQSNT